MELSELDEQKLATEEDIMEVKLNRSWRSDRIDDNVVQLRMMKGDGGFKEELTLIYPSLSQQDACCSVHEIPNAMQRNPPSSKTATNMRQMKHTGIQSNFHPNSCGVKIFRDFLHSVCGNRRNEWSGDPAKHGGMGNKKK